MTCGVDGTANWHQNKNYERCGADRVDKSPRLGARGSHAKLRQRCGG